MYFEVTYKGDLLAEIQCSDVKNGLDLQRKLEALWAIHSDNYDLANEYDEIKDWITDLTLNPVYNEGN